MANIGKIRFSTNTEKKLWNAAINAAYKEILKWDGIIPEERERQYMAEAIKTKLTYAFEGYQKATP